LYPTKNITSAEGGMITTSDDKIAEKSRVIRQHGMRRRYYHEELGFNFRMTDLHAAVGLEQLKKIERFNHARQENARYLSAHLRGLIVPRVPSGYEHVFHQYTVRVKGGHRDDLADYLRKREIGTGIYYPVPIHKQTYYINELGYDQDLPEAERAAEEVLSLPVHPSLSELQLEKIVAAVNQFVDDHADISISLTV
jgi:perosamine synthetase